jgi:hypothetical protein
MAKIIVAQFYIPFNPRLLPALCGDTPDSISDKPPQDDEGVDQYQKDDDARQRDYYLQHIIKGFTAGFGTQDK